MRKVYDRSVRENTEYGGELVRSGRGFRFTTPKRGNEASVPIDPNVRHYEGAYHSHGAADPRYDSENFSDEDRDVADATQRPVYVVTPSGRMRRYDADPQRQRQGVESEIGQVRP